jgi:O6-methylguanine-DNA--protein-cysteine methyltransferase
MMRKAQGHAGMRYEQNLIIFQTPLCWAGVTASEQGICKVIVPKKDKKAVEKELRAETGDTTPSSNSKIIDKAVKLLQKYFSGERVAFDLPLDMRYYTKFQQAVWRAAAEIPYGETRSYAWIAKQIKNPKAVRAVGQALGANPLPIIIP